MRPWRSRAAGREKRSVSGVAGPRSPPRLRRCQHHRRPSGRERGDRRRRREPLPAERDRADTHGARGPELSEGDDPAGLRRQHGPRPAGGCNPDGADGAVERHPDRRAGFHTQPAGREMHGRRGDEQARRLGMAGQPADPRGAADDRLRHERRSRHDRACGPQRPVSGHHGRQRRSVRAAECDPLERPGEAGRLHPGQARGVDSDRRARPRNDDRDGGRTQDGDHGEHDPRPAPVLLHPPGRCKRGRRASRGAEYVVWSAWASLCCSALPAVCRPQSELGHQDLCTHLSEGLAAVPLLPMRQPGGGRGDPRTAE